MVKNLPWSGHWRVRSLLNKVCIHQNLLAWGVTNWVLHLFRGTTDTPNHLARSPSTFWAGPLVVLGIKIKFSKVSWSFSAIRNVFIIKIASSLFYSANIELILTLQSWHWCADAIAIESPHMERASDVFPDDSPSNAKMCAHMGTEGVEYVDCSWVSSVDDQVFFHYQ